MAFETPADHRYLESHEWVRVENGTGTVGITDFAQDELGDVVFVELPEVDEGFEQGEQFGMIESIKAMSDLFLPVSGTVVDVNEALYDSPELVNQDPYGDGWMLRIEIDDADEIESLQTAAEYTEQTE
ncbi:glycine cleavage system protein GcvH [Halorubrum sp. DTA98]|uniref:glycine cleavage system protein GcvH n=1 Tax=Halorubrum sp. DTA98 TaxID=3402163 RepID=UPI003AB07401